MNIGIQDVAGGVYTCVAINGQETNSINVTIKPTGEYCDKHVLHLAITQCILIRVVFVHYISEVLKAPKGDIWQQ